MTSAQPGTDPFPRGSPVFHNRRLCPDPSCRPDRYLRSRPPALAEGTTHTPASLLLPPLQPHPALITPSSSCSLAAGPLPYKVRSAPGLHLQVTPLSEGRLSQPIPATWPSSLALRAAGEVGQVAIPLPVQPVGCDGRRRNGSLRNSSLPVPARGATVGVHPPGSCRRDQHLGHGSPRGRWGWAGAGRRPRRCPTCCHSSPFLATCQPVRSPLCSVTCQQEEPSWSPGQEAGKPLL